MSVIGWFRRTGQSPIPVVKDQQGGDSDSLQCTYCGGTDFLEGPSGGVSTNVLCANDKCRHWFNWTPMIDRLDDLHRIEPTDEERAAEVAKSKTDAVSAFEARREEGWNAYGKFLSIGNCAGASDNPHIAEPINGASNLRRSNAYDGYSEPYTNIDRLVGYVEAMANHVHVLEARIKALEDEQRGVKP